MRIRSTRLWRPWVWRTFRMWEVMRFAPRLLGNGFSLPTSHRPIASFRFIMSWPRLLAIPASCYSFVSTRLRQEGKLQFSYQMSCTESSRTSTQTSSASWRSWVSFTHASWWSMIEPSRPSGEAGSLPSTSRTRRTSKSVCETMAAPGNGLMTTASATYPLACQRSRLSPPLARKSSSTKFTLLTLAGRTNSIRPSHASPSGTANRSPKWSCRISATSWNPTASHSHGSRATSSSSTTTSHITPVGPSPGDVAYSLR
mmetsp:Transcript_4715/g.9524  ORF Transcript_4715/g.9524 Transcript_4715/m.9524 type:complete len:257 (-) Transcript_4715:2159-2929(-)